MGRFFWRTPAIAPPPDTALRLANVPVPLRSPAAGSGFPRPPASSGLGSRSLGDHDVEVVEEQIDLVVTSADLALKRPAGQRGHAHVALREHFARELHDALAGQLRTMLVQKELLRRHGEAPREIETFQAATRQALGSLREALYQLRERPELPGGDPRADRPQGGGRAGNAAGERAIGSSQL
jgi:signal transduction histidine kinase